MLRVIILTVLVMAVLGGALWVAFSAGRVDEARRLRESDAARREDDLPRIDTPPPPLPPRGGTDHQPEDDR